MSESSATTRAITANLITVQEAATRQCRAASAIQSNGFENRWFFPVCAGPACMQWRFHTVPERITSTSTPAEEPRGCCGLAGHP